MKGKKTFGGSTTKKMVINKFPKNLITCTSEYMPY